MQTGYMKNPAVELVRIKESCRQIIEKYISPQAQDNIANRASELLRKKADGGTLSSDEVLFLDNQKDMNIYIRAMRDHCETMIGNADYADESEWPTAPQNVIDLGQAN